MTHRPSTRGFTIVELLVVAAIMATLLGLILAGGRPSTASEVRRAARQIAAVLLSAQSRAIGSRIGAAVLLEPESDPSKADRALRIRDADMAPAITAEVISPFQTTPLKDVVQNPPFRPDASAVVIPYISGDKPVVPENASTADLDGGFRIRFMRPGTPWSAWYGFLVDQTTTPIVLLRINAGQTSETSVWPGSILVPPNGPLPKYRVEISRYPGIGTAALNLSKLVAIDLRYSGHGDDAATTSTWGRLASKGVIGLAYDTVGAVELLMQNVTGNGGSRAALPLSPTRPIYLFVVSREELDAELATPPGPSTLASEQAFWVAIEPQTGRVHVAANEPQSLPALAVPTVDQLRAARKLARNATVLPK
jgi:prepilin-type N-terminal cleavage/methylation domain-containing protein